MDILLIPCLNLIHNLLNLLDWAIFVSVILSLLIHFQILNPYHRGVSTILNLLDQILEPLLSPIRRRLPVWGYFDLSPLVLILGIHFLQTMIQQIILHLLR